MDGKPIVTKIEYHEFRADLKNVGLDSTGVIPTWVPGATWPRTCGALRIHTDAGVVGEFAGFSKMEAMTLPMLASYLIGKNALERERIYRDTKLSVRWLGHVGIGIVDIALWDLAGKYHKSPIYELLGGYRTKLPAYASTMNGAMSGPLSTPESYADFAEQCLALGYPGFKIHPRPGGPIDWHIATVHAVGKRVGDKMALMLDPFCYYETLGDALRVGRACDEESFFWLEDPYADGGVSQFGHRKLRQLIKTPLLQAEHVRRLEPHVDFILADATDFIRGDVLNDGITATMKLAHAAEGLGIDIEYHGCGPAQRHCMAATRNSNFYEMVWVHPDMPSSAPPIHRDGYQDTLYSVDKQGCVSVPTGHGLGVEYDWDFIEKHRTGGAEFV